jgi:hypothetical protein
LWSEQGSQAYAKALAKAGVIMDEEAATLVEGLAKCAHCSRHCCVCGSFWVSADSSGGLVLRQG